MPQLLEYVHHFPFIVQSEWEGSFFGGGWGIPRESKGSLKRGPAETTWSVANCVFVCDTGSGCSEILLVVFVSIFQE